MGMFDSVWLECKACGEELEFQSKVGDCVLANYTINNAPPKILLDIDGQVGICMGCRCPNKIHVQVMTCVHVK